MKHLLVSVVIPVYNMEAHILRAAESVLWQPRADFLELLLVDDGSKDKSGMICDQIALTYHSFRSVRVFHKENGGASSAMNLGIQEASGKYICFLDADDWWEPGFFDDQLIKMLEEDFDIYNFSYQSVSPDMRWQIVYKIEDKEQRELLPDSNRPYYIRHWAYIHRRDHLLRHGLSYPICNVNEDVAFVHVVSALAGSIKSCSRVMLTYWLNPKSCVHTGSHKDMMIEILKSLRLEKEMFVDRGFDYSNDSAVLSAIARGLPTVCSQMGYRELQEYLTKPEFDLLRQDVVQPWSNYRHLLKSYKKHPRLFWARCRILPGISLAAKHFLYKTPSLMRIACYFYYHLKLRWRSYSFQDQTFVHEVHSGDKQ